MGEVKVCNFQGCYKKDCSFYLGNTVYYFLVLFHSRITHSGRNKMLCWEHFQAVSVEALRGEEWRLLDNSQRETKAFQALHDSLEVSFPVPAGPCWELDYLLERTWAGTLKLRWSQVSDLKILWDNKEYLLNCYIRWGGRELLLHRLRKQTQPPFYTWRHFLILSPCLKNL